MEAWALILPAVMLDLLLGDPRRFPHPVRGMGAMATWLEGPLRRRVANTRAAGVLAVLLVTGTSAGLALGLIRLARLVHPAAGALISILILYTTFAAKDLHEHSRKVFSALKGGDLPLARNRVARIVGRDTEGLDASGVARATVETVAENTVDGLTAPLFYAAIGGPVLAVAYKAASTLDSMFGHRNERYVDFGWAAARLDDAAAYLPARFTAWIVPIAATLLGLDGKAAWLTYRRDGRKHPSPNAGLCEAAFAGALGVRLGGPSTYGGVLSEKATLGEPVVSIGPEQIHQANRLMLTTYGVAVVLFLSAAGLLHACKAAPGGVP
jgi:adenosylcobinamide-phosphate synthase